jgi:hypothetical protein
MKTVKYLEDILSGYQTLKSRKIDLPNLTSQLSVWLENLNWNSSIQDFLDYQPKLSHYKIGSLKFDAQNFCENVQKYTQKIQNSHSKNSDKKDKNEFQKGNNLESKIVLPDFENGHKNLEKLIDFDLNFDLNSEDRQELIDLTMILLDTLVCIYKELYLITQKTISAENFLVLEMSKHWEKGSFLYSSNMGIKKRDITTCFESLKLEIDNLKTILEIRESFLETFYEFYNFTTNQNYFQKELENLGFIEKILLTFGLDRLKTEYNFLDFLDFWLEDEFIIFLENKIWNILQDIIFDGNSYSFVNYKNSSILIFESQDFDIPSYLENLIKIPAGETVSSNFWESFGENLNHSASPNSTALDIQKDTKQTNFEEDFIENNTDDTNIQNQISNFKYSENKHPENDKVKFLTRFSQDQLLEFINDYNLQEWSKKVSFEILPKTEYSTVYDLNLGLKLDCQKFQQNEQTSVAGFENKLAGKTENNFENSLENEPENQDNNSRFQVFPILLIASKNNMLLKYQREILENFCAYEFLVVGETGSLTKIVSKLSPKIKICLIRLRDLAYFLEHADVSSFRSVYFLGEPYLGDIPKAQKAGKLYLKSQFNWVGQKYPKIKIFYLQNN